MASEDKILTVSEISQLIAEALEKNFNHLNIEGEITDVSKSGNGHVYFSLKDEGALINVVCWKGKSQEVINLLRDGQYVICSGELKIYKKNSRYQLVLHSVKSLSDEGKILLALEKLKEKLTSEGIFDSKRKRQLPKFPKKLGLITSSSGAVIEDMLHRIRDRYPCGVVLYSVPVQGGSAIRKIIEGLNFLDNEECDIIVVARGGGSQDDLKCFSEEALIRVASEMKTPTVSAIGHETDWSLLDLVADLRVPTPTAAIEIILPIKKDVQFKIDKNLELIENSIKQKFDYLKFTIKSFFNIRYLVENKMSFLQISLEKQLKNLDDVTRLMLRNTQQIVDMFRIELQKYNIENILKMGFAILKQNGKIIQLKSELIVNTAFEIYFADGSLVVEEVAV